MGEIAGPRLLSLGKMRSRGSSSLQKRSTFEHGGQFRAMRSPPASRPKTVELQIAGTNNNASTAAFAAIGIRCWGTAGSFGKPNESKLPNHQDFDEN